MNWRKVTLTECDVKQKITQEKERLIRFSDHDEDEDTIGLLMDLEVNQEDHKYNRETLERRIEKLESIIEHLVDNYDIDLRDIDEKDFNGLPGGLSQKSKVVTDEMWLEATKQRRRETRLGELLDKENINVETTSKEES